MSGRRQTFAKKVTAFSLCLCTAMMAGQLSAAEGGQCQPASTDLETASATIDVSDKASFETVYAGVECLLQSADEAGAEWLKTRELLLNSKQEADQENWSKASQLLESARFQATTALQQSAHEAEAWKQRVVR